MQAFIPLDFNNALQVRALCEDLQLVPECFCTPEMLRYWREILTNSFERDLTEVEKRISHEYCKNLIESMRKRRYSKKLDYNDDCLLELNF